MTVKKLNLPPPSSELIQAFRQWEHSIELLTSSKIWLDNFHDNKINSAAHWFGLIPELNKLAQQQYQKYFVQPVLAGGGVMENIQDTPAMMPPHSDRGRKLAINWYIDLGGDSVDTVFYHETAATFDQATNFKYQDVHEDQRYRFDNASWYAYSVNRAHAVENIKTRRTFLALTVDNSLEFDLTNLNIDSDTQIAL